MAKRSLLSERRSYLSLVEHISVAFRIYKGNFTTVVLTYSLTKNAYNTK